MFSSLAVDACSMFSSSFELARQKELDVKNSTASGRLFATCPNVLFALAEYYLAIKNESSMYSLPRL